MTKRNIQGFTFTELMIALTINMLLLAALLTVFLANLDHYHKMVNSNRLTQQLQSALDMMSDDIRRAGYWSNANGDIGLDQNSNPFMAAGVDITVSASNDCILFAYDRDFNGSLPGINASIDDERYGYRLSSNTLQARPPGATFSCTAAANNWENVTDPNVVKITALTFTLNTSTITTGPGTRGLAMRSVDISITGTLANDATVTNTLSQHVRVRNDKFIP